MVISVLDSGYSGKYTDRIVGGISISNEKGKLVFKDDFSDTCGHGTAVIDLLMKYCDSSVEFFVIQILDEEEKCTFDVLNSAFKYIDEKVDCGLVHISAGIERLEDVQILKNTILRLTERGTFVVAAYANNGSVSYPAAFENVFGVDISDRRIKKNEFEVVESSIVDFRTSPQYYRVNWNGTSMILNGSSFSSTVITAEICKVLKQNKNMSFDEVKKCLKNKSVNVYREQQLQQLTSAKEIANQIKRAIIFPFNKEMYPLAGNEDMCSFEIVGYYTHKYDMNVGKTISQVLDYTQNSKKIENVDQISWNDEFDTLILGHCGEASEILGKDIASKILKLASENGKRVYSLSNVVHLIRNYPACVKQFSFPYVDASNVPKNRFGKLRKTSRPMIAIMGTSSKQGKFHVQLTLKKMFEDAGYTVFQIATEPTGYLFQMDYVYPMGYESTIYVQEQEAILTLNDQLRGADEKNADIIICGSQSGTIPFRYDNISQMTVQQTEFLMALNPDAAILCINYDDDMTYIERTKRFIESVCICKVIGFAMLPVRYEKSLASLKKIALNDSEKEEKAKMINEVFDSSLFYIGNQHDMNKLYDKTIDFFSGE